MSPVPVNASRKILLYALILFVSDNPILPVGTILLHMYSEWAVIFAGTSTDLVPTLLGMYDDLIGRSSQATERSMEEARISVVPSGVSRPLSVSSIASSSSSSSGTSSCSGGGRRRLGAAPKSSAYLASIESLEDDSDDPESGDGGGGGGGKQRLHHQKPIISRAERLKGGSGGSQGQYMFRYIEEDMDWVVN